MRLADHLTVLRRSLVHAIRMSGWVGENPTLLRPGIARIARVDGGMTTAMHETSAPPPPPTPNIYNS